jgi:ABC-type branched-subunit amino acid transport system substrate-binding protein
MIPFWIGSQRTVAGLLLIAGGALATVPLVASCKEDAAPPEAAGTLDIGTLTSVSGDLAALGLEFNDATQLAIDDINASGGILGRKINLVVRDDGTSTSQAYDGFLQLRNLHVPLVLGPTTSSQVDALVPLIATGNTVTVGRTTTADELTTIPDHGYFFRLAPSDKYQAQVLAQIIAASKIEHLCLVHRKDVYGNELSAKIEDQLKTASAAIQAPAIDVTESVYDPTSSDLTSVMPQCASLICDSGADAGSPCAAPAPDKVGLLLVTYIEDGALILDDAKRRGWSAKKQQFFFTDGSYDRALLTRIKDPSNLEGAKGTAPAGPDPSLPEGELLRQFTAHYRDRYNHDPSLFIENAFDSMYVAAIAIEIAKTTTPGPAIRDAMKQVSVPGGLKVNAGDWTSIRQAIASGKPIDFVGASGECDFDDNGDVKPPYNYVIWTVEGGQIAVNDRVVIH